jgi:hypothetical protein
MAIMIVIESTDNSFSLADRCDTMVHFIFLASLGLGSSVLAAPNYVVPDAQPKNAVAIDPAPVGAS